MKQLETFTLSRVTDMFQWCFKYRRCKSLILFNRNSDNKILKHGCFTICFKVFDVYDIIEADIEDLKHLLSESLKTGLFQKEQLKNLSNRPTLTPCRKAKFLKNSPLLLKEGQGVVVFVKKPNQKFTKTLLTAKYSNKTPFILSKTSILLIISTAKPC